jgi:osmotically-inducible protein OsmY
MGMGGFGQTGMMGGLGAGYGALMQSGYAGLQGGTGMTGTGQQFGQMGRGQTMNMMGTMGRTTTTGGARGGMAGNQAMTAAATQNTQPPVPIRVEVGFSAPRPAATAIATNIQARVGQIVAQRNLGQARVDLQDGIVVLSGTAPTDSQRMVIENIVRMQPGVSVVRNEIVVAPSEEAND